MVLLLPPLLLLVQGHPVFLKGSHRNRSVKGDAVFVSLTEEAPREDGAHGDSGSGANDGGRDTHPSLAAAFPEQLAFRPKAGDLLVWHSRCALGE